jgi:LytS/YehU family sensor histidine kinase
MKLPVYSKYDSVLQLIFIPINSCMLSWIMIGNSYWTNPLSFGLATLLTAAFSFSVWIMGNYMGLKINARHPHPRQYVMRALLRFLASSTSASLHALVLFQIFTNIHIPGFSADPLRLLFSVLFVIVTVAIVMITYETVDSYDNWQEAQQQIEALTKAQMQVQLDALRQQVNPHFLFNSLNSLTVLISEDPQKAETFSEELSSVYRYLLRSNEAPLVPLADELDFVTSYFHLLKTRHGEAISLETRIRAGMELYQLPPLTLQLLIENAVKHNNILPEQPLIIALSTDEQQRLVVSNNLQRKPSRSLSNGIGLSNILTKYQMLGQPAPTIEEDGQAFRVILPLV